MAHFTRGIAVGYVWNGAVYVEIDTQLTCNGICWVSQNGTEQERDMRRAGCMLGLAMLLAGCSDTTVEPAFRGIYSEGFEVSGFTPCGGGRDAWLYDNDGQLRAAENQIARQRSQFNQPYPHVYVEFDGVDEGKGSEGFPADYDRVIRVTRLYTVSPNVPTGCPYSVE